MCTLLLGLKCYVILSIISIYRLYGQNFAFNMYWFHQHASINIHLADESPNNCGSVGHLTTIYNVQKPSAISLILCTKTIYTAHSKVLRSGILFCIIYKGPGTFTMHTQHSTLQSCTFDQNYSSVPLLYIFN